MKIMKLQISVLAIGLAVAGTMASATNSSNANNPAAPSEVTGEVMLKDNPTVNRHIKSDPVLGRSDPILEMAPPQSAPSLRPGTETERPESIWLFFEAAGEHEMYPA